MRRALLIFLDGVGLGESDPAVNPMAAARLPTLLRLLDGRRPLAESAPLHGTYASFVGLDASLGLPGLPQSGTGQAALLTGDNAARLFGRHFGPWTPTAIRGLVARESLLARAVRAGRRAAFANAYPEELVGAVDLPGRQLHGAGGSGGDPGGATDAYGDGDAGDELDRSALRRLPGPLRAGPPLAALGAGLLTRHTAELARGDAVASEITNHGWRERLGRVDLPVITPDHAGRNLARVAADHHLTLFAHYTTDHVGHRGDYDDAVAVLERVDAFLGGVLHALPPEVLVVVASDHGNIEDVQAGHTLNPALALVIGPEHAELAVRLQALTDVAPMLLRFLGVE